MTFVVSASVASLWLTEFKVCYHAVHFQYSVEIAGDDTMCMIHTEHDNSFGPVLTGVAYRHIFYYKV
jgi:hypothetical protein